MVEAVDDDDEISGSPSFIKIILAPKNDLQKLEIPAEFMKRYGDRFSNVVHLSVPNGAVWETKVVREKGKAWLQNGWPEFVEFYSITHTYVLVFKIEPNSGFHVIIMSNSASEIEYPIIRSTHKRDMNPKRVMVMGKRCCLSPDEIKRVKEYQCKQPSFVVKLWPSQVHPRFNALSIPIEFARMYLRLQHGLCRFVLQVQGAAQKTWSVNGKIYETNHVQLVQGWKNFSIDNKLLAGNICVFELIKGTKNKFRVGILPCCSSK